MKKLLSLPPNLVECFHDITQTSPDEWFCTNDPIGKKLGSGGGTTHLLRNCMEAEQWSSSFEEWVGQEKRILLHAGGQSRRLPGYAPSGKILTPIPVFRWKRGQKLSQNLLDLQLPLYQQIMEKAPENLHTMIVSGDVFIRTNRPLQDIPDADVVCYGLWVDPNLAKNHGVFVSKRTAPEVLDFMLQKPSVETLGGLMQQYLFLMDIGIWLLSDRAVALLAARSTQPDGQTGCYDLYSEFGLALGNSPRIIDPELNQLKVAIIPLAGGEFLHYGTSREMISSTLTIQNSVTDQREIMHHDVKPHPAIFVQNAQTDIALSSSNANVWIENSHIAKGWKLSCHNIITGIPHNDWTLRLDEGICLDAVPVGEHGYAARPYGFNDAFKGSLLPTVLADGTTEASDTQYQGRSITCWLNERQLQASEIEGHHDLQAARIFPICQNIDELGLVLRWMTHEPTLEAGRQIWLQARKVSADEISAEANLRRLNQQREHFRQDNWSMLARNHKKSVFYQINLEDAAQEFVKYGLDNPSPLDETTNRMTRISDAMFRSRLEALRQHPTEAKFFEDQAFSMMCEGLTDTACDRQHPRLSVYADQIVWGRSPVRIDLAGGWTDTPPYSLMQGGNVVNIAIELNGQPPLQVYIKPAKEYHIILRSIDLGASEIVSTFEDLQQFNKVGSPFSIPKAALVLAGFHPRFSAQQHLTLQETLQAFGSGLEMTMLSAIPAGSGLGTSSILASTVLGAINEFCGLGWDRYEISNRTLILEQLLTTGGGWQDQYGGVLHGVKLLQTQSGWQQQPLVRWLPDTLFTAPEYHKCHLLYYTGITRTAKGILAEIVRGMFLNSTEHLELLAQMKQHAIDLYDAIQRNDFTALGQMVGKTWIQNQRLDSGTNPPAVQAITQKIDDLCLGYKLPGAGGGGYLYMVAKDEEAAARIHKILTNEPINDKARFVEMTLSQKGLEISKS